MYTLKGRSPAPFEEQTAKLPSDLFLCVVGLIIAAPIPKVADKHHDSTLRARPAQGRQHALKRNPYAMKEMPNRFPCENELSRATANLSSD